MRRSKIRESSIIFTNIGIAKHHDRFLNFCISCLSLVFQSVSGLSVYQWFVHLSVVCLSVSGLSVYLLVAFLPVGGLFVCKLTVCLSVVVCLSFWHSLYVRLSVCMSV